ncbi:MAG: Vitamin B12 dependent methionine synthase activation subunit [Clostridia bacterium]|nr:Vitamin B12 dependent methionine synthase activation subunit [Clostridia bacterium]
MLLKYELQETARYMGYKHGAEPSEEICELVDEAYIELCKVIQPKYIYKEYDFTRTEDGIMVDGIEFKSKKLLTHIRKSTSIILFGATLGQGADALIRKYSVTDIAMTAVAQAVAGSMVENLCDIACDEMKKEIKGEHRPRFSPGYGDFHISAQEDFFRLLPMNKQLGISLSDGFMMTPTKTVTAFIGVIKE